MINVSKLSEFWQWWVSELFDILPSSNNISLNHESDMQIYIEKKKCKLELIEQNVSLENDESFVSSIILNKYLSAIEDLGNHPADSCDLRINKNILLTRTITLPLATEENIADVVAYEIDRYTPFKKEDVYFDIDIVSKDREGNKLTAIVTVIKKNTLDEVFEFCEQSGLVLNNIYAQADSGDISELKFEGLPDNIANKNNGSSNKYMLIFTLVLLIIALIIPIAKNYWLSSKYEVEIQSMSSQLAEVKELRSEFHTLRKQADQANSLQGNSMRLIDLLDELTKIVPNDTSLARLSFEEDVVRMQGSSDSASMLIAILDSSKAFTDVEFAAPVTKNSDLDKENFTIQVKVNNANDGATE